MGPTGAGKTTIISLLSRFYDVSKAAAFASTMSISAPLTQNSIREQLGIVLQDTFLFSGTVMENFRYGRLDATDAEVIEAAKAGERRRLHPFAAARLPDASIRKGHNFSQGQRQLLAIARAILADPQILILDEATSSVDTRTEIHIQEAAAALCSEGRTAFVIAHRLSTIRNADQVLGWSTTIASSSAVRTKNCWPLGGFYHQLYMSQYHRLEELVAVK